MRVKTRKNWLIKAGVMPRIDKRPRHHHVMQASEILYIIIFILTAILLYPLILGLANLLVWIIS